MSQKDQNLWRGRSVDTRLIINKEVDDAGNTFYLGIFGDHDRGTLGVLKIGEIRLSPEVFEMIIDDMHKTQGNA